MTQLSPEEAVLLESQANRGLPTENTTRESQDYQSGLEDTQILSPTREYPPRVGRTRINKNDPKDPSVKAQEVNASVKDLPFTASRIRVGIGGEFLVLQLAADAKPVILRNIADGETFDLRVVRILETDCSNIVIFD